MINPVVSFRIAVSVKRFENKEKKDYELHRSMLFSLAAA
jgi:hypothetical protein